MSKEQINELAADIYSMLRSDNLSRALASLLYGKGWRKQSEGEWIETDDENGYESYRCSNCECEQVAKTIHCSNCGAKMKNAKGVGK